MDNHQEFSVALSANVNPPKILNVVFSSYESFSTAWIYTWLMISHPRQLNYVYSLEESSIMYLPVTECFSFILSPKFMFSPTYFYTHFIFQFIAASARSSGIPWTMGRSQVVSPKLVSSTLRLYPMIELLILTTSPHWMG